MHRKLTRRNHNPVMGRGRGFLMGLAVWLGAGSLFFGGCAGGGDNVKSGGPKESSKGNGAGGGHLETRGGGGNGSKGPGKGKASPPVFAKDFQDRTLRVDLVHRGMADPATERFEVERLVLEGGAWPGSRTVLVDPDDFGIHRFDVREKSTGRLLFRHGFGSLFSEWQTTGEAKKKARAFSESVRFPQPRRPFILEMFTRRKDNTMRRVSRFELDPSRAVAGKDPSGGTVKPKRVHGKRPPHRALDVLLIADGYTASEREAAERAGRRFAEVLLNTPPFARHREAINFWVLAPPSKGSGVSEPRKGLELDTPVGLSFNALGSPRYMMTLENKKLRAWAALAPYDQLYLMANTSRYGGGGIYNLYSTFPADNEFSEYVFVFWGPRRRVL